MQATHISTLRTNVHVASAEIPLGTTIQDRLDLSLFRRRHNTLTSELIVSDMRASHSKGHRTGMQRNSTPCLLVTWRTVNELLLSGTGSYNQHTREEEQHHQCPGYSGPCHFGTPLRSDNFALFRCEPRCS